MRTKPADLHIILSSLSERVNIFRSQNKDVWVSKQCPFCHYVSKKSNVFRFNRQLNVGKSYCCGKSFTNPTLLKRYLKDAISQPLPYLKLAYLQCRNKSGVGYIPYSEIEKWYKDNVRFFASTKDLSSDINPF
jgi:hypothetical protein